METTRLIPPDAPRPGGRASRPPFDAGLAKAQGADQVISLGEGGEEPRARCALWWKDTPVVNGANIGYIGHYAAVDSAAASALLEQACRVLAEYGAALAIGPLDGTTWRPHRLAIDGLNRPPFFMEPRNPADWPQHFLENGFHILANYSSSAVDLTRPLENTTAFDRVRRRLTGQNGIVVRPVDPERIDQELCGIYRLARDSFRNNFLYQPLPEAEFVATYRRVAPFLVPEFVRIAEADGGIAGFVFAIPDVEGIAKSGSREPAVIVKTVAARPGRRFAGLGNLLVREVHEHARQRGHREIIHALQHEHNPSLAINARCGATVFRRYALFARTLLP